MSNKYFNFNIPAFNEKYGEDWSDFQEIVDDNVDYIMQRTYDLYLLNDINRIGIYAINYLLDAYDIEYNATDTLIQKRTAFRNAVSNFDDKGLEIFYTNGIDAIVGGYSSIIGWEIFGYFRDSYSRWPASGSPTASDWRWATEDGKFHIYIDPDTTDTTPGGLIEQVEDWLLLDYIYPAFYKIYLVDSSYNIISYYEDGVFVRT